MSSTPRQLLFSFARRYPLRIALNVILNFSGAIFNGVNTALLVPVFLQLAGQEIDIERMPDILKAILGPFELVPEKYRLLLMLGAIILTLILKNLTKYISTLVSVSFRRSLMNDIREAGLQMLLDVDLDYFSKMKTGDIVARLSGESLQTTGAINTYVNTIGVATTILVFISILLNISWQLTIASTFLLAAVVTINQLFNRRAKYYGKKLTEMSRAYSSTLLEMLNGMRLVKATGNEEQEYKQISKLIRAHEQAEFEAKMNSAAVGPLSEMTGIMALIVVTLIGRTFFADQLEALSAVLLTYLVVLFRLLPFISQLNSIRNSLAKTSASVEIVHDFLRRDNKPFMVKGSVPYKGMVEGIHFNRISFCYPSSSNQVLSDVDLFLPRGQTLALVGGSGAGKSTIADLLARFYEPTAGSITIDGRDMREFDLKTIRKAMGIVSQDTFLFNTTVRNNINYARPEATSAEIIDAAKRANAYEFIEKLSQGLDTQIGDRGVMLSGGQRQRLAIARALLQDPDILILDEATSALDTVSERLVQEAIDELSRDRTVLVIAHRLSTVQKADIIAVLDKGRAVETGTHTELLEKDGHYQRLYSMQFADQAEAPTHDPVVAKASYEARTSLNSMIGSLRLLADEIVDTPEEQMELTEEAYRSAVNLLRTLEVFENKLR
ncbi:MAG: ABC transporter ATP-binding protein [Hormoscilla sp.]